MDGPVEVYDQWQHMVERMENMHLDSIPELEEYEYNDNEYEQDREMFETTDIQNRKYKKKQKV